MSNFLEKRITKVNELQRNYAYMAEMRESGQAELLTPFDLNRTMEITARRLADWGIGIGEIGEKVQSRLRRDEIRKAGGQPPLRSIGRHRR